MHAALEASSADRLSVPRGNRGLPPIVRVLVVLAILAGTAAAFVVTEKLKIQRAPVGSPLFSQAFSPTCECETAVAELRFRVRKSDRVTALVVDDEGAPVRTLLERKRIGRGPVTLEWDGRTDSATIAPDGLYRLRVDLAGEGRTIVFPSTVRLDTRSPEVEIVRIGPSEIAPTGELGGPRVRVVYRADEKAAAVILVDGTVAVHGRRRAPGRGRVAWRGTVNGELVAPGDYRLEFVVIDEAGNRSEPAVEVIVRVRPS